MARVRPGHATHRRRKRMLRAASGFWGSRSKLFRVAKQFVVKARVYAFRDRRVRKREFRSLWIIRVSAACDARGISYSCFVAGLKHAGVFLNRKMLSELAIQDPAVFDKLVELARAARPAAA
jgi:large subunit ribosomal protein L20